MRGARLRLCDRMGIQVQPRPSVCIILLARYINVEDMWGELIAIT